MRKPTIHKTGLHLFMINAFIYISFALFTPFMSPYYTKAGMSAVEIGILLTIAPIFSCLIQPLWAILSDRTGRRRRVLSIVAFGSSLSVLSYYIGKTFLFFLIASILLAIFMTSIVPLSDAIILRSTEKNQLDFSKIRMGGTIGYAIFVTIAGSIVRINPNLAFAMGSIGFLVLFFLVLLLPRDEQGDSPKITEKTPAVKERNTKRSLFHIFETKEIYFLLAFAFISQFGLSFHFSFQGVYMLEMGLTEHTIGITSSIAALSELPILFVINRVMKKLRAERIILIACLLLGLRIFMFTGEGLLFVILSHILHGITYMSIYFCCAVFISRNVKPENQSKGQSILALLQTGIASITGNILGGLLVDLYSMKTAYRIISVLVVAAAGLIALLQFLYQRKQVSE
jgi:MFS transporter, PPP family, 3-phenylpropionic acid transporter